MRGFRLWGAGGIVVALVGVAIHLATGWPALLVPLAFLVAAICLGVGMVRRAVPAVVAGLVVFLTAGVLGAMFATSTGSATFGFSQFTAPFLAAVGLACCLGAILTSER